MHYYAMIRELPLRRLALQQSLLGLVCSLLIIIAVSPQIAHAPVLSVVAIALLVVLHVSFWVRHLLFLRRLRRESNQHTALQRLASLGLI